MTFGLTEFLFGVVAVVICAIQYLKRTKNVNGKVLPGPRPLPLLGNVLQLTDKPHLQLYNWMEEYGKMYKVQFGGNNAVIVNDVKIAKELLFDSDFDDRPDMFPFSLLSGGKYGIAFNVGTAWKQQRRWASRKLREHGFGRTASLEGIIMTEVNEVVAFFKENEGKPVVLKERFHIAVLNSIWTILNGERLSQNDPKILDVIHTMQPLAKLITESGLSLAPWLRYIFRGTYKKIEEGTGKILNYAKNAVTEHLETHKDGEIRDFIDEYIEEIKRTTDPMSSFYKETGRKNLEAVISDFFAAGSDTSSNTIDWCICYLTWKPVIQRKVQQELDAILGSRAVTMNDKSNLPYTEAVILETLRKSALIASGVQHLARKDKVVDGYHIPKGYWVMPNIYNIHHDKSVWGDPENFRPERFLSPDGKTVVRNESLIPFQIGRRQCLGESLARDTLFLFIATLFQKFNITRVESGEPQPENGMIILHPEAYNFIFELRPEEQD